MGHVVKVKKHLLLEKNTKEIYEDVSIVKLNISNLSQSRHSTEKSTEILQNRSATYYFKQKTVVFITRLMLKYM